MTRVDTEGMKADFKALRSEVIEISKGQSCTEGAVVSVSTVQMPKAGNNRSGTVALRKNVRRLNNKLRAREVNVTEPADTVAAVGTRPADCGSGRRVQSHRSDDDHFCYRCGEDGHIATKFSSDENAKK